MLPNARDEVLDGLVIGHDVDHAAVQECLMFQVLRCSLTKGDERKYHQNINTFQKHQQNINDLSTKYQQIINLKNDINILSMNP